jgi:antitoxin component YwqK of YwqJK toxin-antitoxin module
LLIIRDDFAQNTNVTPKLEVVGNLVKATFHDDGKTRRFYENGKPRQMVSYDINGNKTAVAEYNKGKVGKWFSGMIQF